MTLVFLFAASFAFTTAPFLRKNIARRAPHHVHWSTQEQEDLNLDESGVLDSSDCLDESELPSSRDREYWLDLRDTAILPNEALEFLEQNLFQEERKEDFEDVSNIISLVDRIILSEDLFQKALSHESSAKLNLLYSPEGDDILVASDPAMQQSFPTGKVVLCSDSEILDPLEALDTTSDGGWLLVDSEISNERDSMDWLASQVSGLIQFLLSSSGSSNGPSTALSSGLLMPTLSGDISGPSRGGVAILCRNRATFLQTNSALEESLGTAMITTSTDSGIILPTGMPERPGCESRLRTAIVLPFDVMLWETARDLRALSDEIL